VRGAVREVVLISAITRSNIVNGEKVPPLVLIPGLAGGLRAARAPLAKLLAGQLSGHQLPAPAAKIIALPSAASFGLDDLVPRPWPSSSTRSCLESPTVFGVSFGGIPRARVRESLRSSSRSADRCRESAARFERGLLQQVAGTVLNRFPLAGGQPVHQSVLQTCCSAAGRKRTRCFEFRQPGSAGRRTQSVMGPSVPARGDLRCEGAARADPCCRPWSCRATAMCWCRRAGLNELCEGIEDVRFARLPGCGHPRLRHEARTRGRKKCASS